MSDELRISMNVVSEVVQNRPPPLREFDQIYMKMGDLTVHSLSVSNKFAGMNVVFVGDGDAVALSIANLLHSGVTTSETAPAHITVLDFDERICHSINDFARRARFSSYIEAKLYNVIDPIPDQYIRHFDAFHMNPPYGQYNSAQSIISLITNGISEQHIKA